MADPSSNPELSVSPPAAEVDQPPAAAETEPVESMDRPYDVFVSYRVKPDESVARAIQRLIEGSIDPTPKVFLSSLGGIVPSNVGFRPQITAAIRQVRAVIGVITSSSKEREWIFFEAGAAWGRDQLYAPVSVKVPLNELPPTLGDYQGIDSLDIGGMRRLVGEIANRCNASMRTHFGKRYAAFKRIAEAYPDDPAEADDPSIVQLFGHLLRDRYVEADALRDKLIEAAENDRQRAEILVTCIVYDSRRRSHQLELLHELPENLRSVSPDYHYWAGFTEVRPHERMRHLRRCLELAPDDVDRRVCLREIIELMWRKGEHTEAFALARDLLTSISPADRSAGATALLAPADKANSVARLAVAAVGLGGEPDEYLFRTAAEVATSNKWTALSLFLCVWFDRRVDSGTSANQLGIGLVKAELRNLGFEAYSRAASRGTSVAKVNMASLGAGHSLAAPGLALMREHTGGFDAASPGYPHSTRSELETTVHGERETLERLRMTGEDHFRLLSEFVETSLDDVTSAAVPTSFQWAGAVHVVAFVEPSGRSFMARRTAGEKTDSVVWFSDPVLPHLWFATAAEEFYVLRVSSGGSSRCLIVNSGAAASAIVNVTVTQAPAPDSPGTVVAEG